MTSVKKILVDEKKCSGCRICELACSASKHGDFNPKRSHIRIKKIERCFVDVPVLCKQCPNPPCVSSCPVDALSGDEDGIIHVAADVCTGCGSCVQACPFEAISLDPLARKAAVCDLCDGTPQCVKWCPTTALAFPLSTTEAGKWQPRTTDERAMGLVRSWGIPAEALGGHQRKE